MDLLYELCKDQMRNSLKYTSKVWKLLVYNVSVNMSNYILCKWMPVRTRCFQVSSPVLFTISCQFKMFFSNVFINIFYFILYMCWVLFQSCDIKLAMLNTHALHTQPPHLRESDSVYLLLTHFCFIYITCAMDVSNAPAKGTLHCGDSQC